MVNDRKLVRSTASKVVLNKKIRKNIEKSSNLAGVFVFITFSSSFCHTISVLNTMVIKTSTPAKFEQYTHIQLRTDKHYDAPKTHDLCLFGLKNDRNWFEQTIFSNDFNAFPFIGRVCRKIKSNFFFWCENFRFFKFCGFLITFEMNGFKEIKNEKENVCKRKKNDTKIIF